jgi:MFS family permease
MLKGPLTSGLGIARKDFFTLFFLFFNTFTWYYITLVMLERFLNTFPVSDADALLIRAVYYAAVIGSTIVGAVAHLTRRLRFLYSWMLLGVVSSLLPAVVSTQGLLWSLLLGVSFGLGIPVALAYFADRSALEGRGRISGVIFFLSNLFAPLFFVSFGMVSLEIAFTLLALWRATGLVVFFLLKPQENPTSEAPKRASFSAIFGNRAFLYYLVPWFMYSLIDQLERVVWANFLGANFPDLNVLLGLGAPIIGAFAALFGGLLSDWIGRKRVVIYGFVALGLAYAIVGVAPMMRFSWYVYLVGDGVAGGAFLAIFIMTLWGDLSQSGAREKYYVIGNLPFYIAAFVPLFLDSYVRSVPPSASFSLASFFLFISVLPLLYATETLPEKKIELRRLRGYVEQAKKLGEKYARKK